VESVLITQNILDSISISEKSVAMMVERIKSPPQLPGLAPVPPLLLVVVVVIVEHILPFFDSLFVHTLLL
jgi:hypothetical protein